MLGQCRKLNFAVDPLQHPDLIEDSFIPLSRGIRHSEGLSKVRNFAMMPADENHFTGIFSAQYFLSESVEIKIREVVIDLKVQSLRKRRNRLNGAIGVLAWGLRQIAPEGVESAVRCASPA